LEHKFVKCSRTLLHRRQRSVGPVILSDSTGHRDLLEDGTAIALRHQVSLPSDGMVGWGNSDIEEMVAALETVYNAREEAQARALRGAANISRLTWMAQINKLGELLLPLMPNR
jgi:glycosyltransferase involved in cell wall biosynthesis